MSDFWRLSDTYISCKSKPIYFVHDPYVVYAHYEGDDKPWAPEPLIAPPKAESETPCKNCAEEKLAEYMNPYELLLKS